MNEKFEQLGFYPRRHPAAAQCRHDQMGRSGLRPVYLSAWYWQEVEEAVGEAPSALRLILPEGSTTRM